MAINGLPPFERRDNSCRSKGVFSQHPADRKKFFQGKKPSVAAFWPSSPPTCSTFWPIYKKLKSIILNLNQMDFSL
jgi:hypothetical protein